ncbi:MAG TPA: hydrolase 1, exosortase A system-associated [Gammaproteobacteria bacterium]|nr:hydrolase 1, exosortase A system-associated [Gammaproteobacteria bacterium]
MNEVDVAEKALVFNCEGSALYGVLHLPDEPLPVAVLIVVGGPQYRVGSHRQFILLARFLAERGVPVLRFDYRGMGDSEGETTFDQANSDIAIAIESLCAEVPNARKVVILGLCDGASAAIFYAHSDERVKGLVLLNPWVRTSSGEAKAYVKHYYANRLLKLDFWKKLLSGRLNLFSSARGFLDMLRKMAGGGESSASNKVSLPERMGKDFQKVSGAALVILSGNQDYVADEFRDLCAGSRLWQELMARPSTSLQEFRQANHTFSRREWRDQVAERVWAWLQRL